VVLKPGRRCCDMDGMARIINKARQIVQNDPANPGRGLHRACVALIPQYGV
jgi:hypothetical protein